MDKYRVLLVEDSPGDMLMARKVLANSAIDIDLLIAHRGEMAIRLLCEHAVDLVLLDLNLPDMSGFEVIEELHEHQQQPPPVYVLSTSRADEDRQRAAELGAAHFESKPRSYSEYADLVRSIEEFLTTAALAP